MNILWLFETSTLRWSFSDVTFDSVDYTRMVDPASFSGITESRMSDESGIINVSDLSFKIMGDADVKGNDLIIKLVVNNVLEKTWKMRIKDTKASYGITTVWAESLLNFFLEGDYPTTVNPKTIWPSDDPDRYDTEDKYVIPVVFGNAYIFSSFVHDLLCHNKLPDFPRQTDPIRL